MIFPIPSFGKQPISRCRTAGSISLMPKIGYHGNMNRPGTPLTPTQWETARTTPGSAAYGDPGGMSDPNILPSGGKFGAQELPSVFDSIVALHRFVPGPGTYEDIVIPMEGGVKFSTAYVPSNVDKLIKVASKAPSPADYDISTSDKVIYPRPDRNVCPFTTSLRPSFIDEVVKAKAYVPAGAKYQASSSSKGGVHKYKRGGNNAGPRRPATVSQFMDEVEHIFAFTDPQRGRTTAQKQEMDVDVPRPMTSPEKFRRQQNTLWSAKKKKYPGKNRRGTRRNHERMQRPSTTGVHTSTSSRIVKRSVPLQQRPSTVMDRVKSRSRQELSKKLTSPLWKYEIPKQLRGKSGKGGAGGTQKKQGMRRASKNRPPRRHNADAQLNDLFNPTASRPFLTLKETMELATRNIRAIDNSMHSNKRKEVLGIL